MGNIGTALIAIIGSVISLAIVSVLVGSNSQTVQVLGASGNALSNVIRAAVSPVQGGTGNLGASSFTTPLGTYI